MISPRERWPLASTCGSRSTAASNVASSQPRVSVCKRPALTSAEASRKPSSGRPARSDHETAVRKFARSAYTRRQPGQLLRSSKRRLRAFGEAHVVLAVAAPEILSVRSFRQSLDGVRAHGLEHPHARLAAVMRSRDEQALRQQRLDGAQVGAHDGFRRLERASAREDGQAGEGRPLVHIEQLMAPIERGTERLLAWRRIPQPADQDGQGIVQAPGQLHGSQQRDVPRGKLDRQRHPVDPPADLRDGSDVPRAQREPRVARPAAVGEQADRRRPLKRLEIEPIQCRRQRERAHDEQLLTRQPERLATGHHDSKPVTGIHELTHDLRRGQDVLEVVEDDEHPLVADQSHEPRKRRFPRERRDPEGNTHGVGDGVRRFRRRQRDKPRAVRVFAMDRACQLERKPRLAYAPGPHERQQALVPQEPAQPGKIVRASHGACAGERQSQRRSPLTGIGRRGARRWVERGVLAQDRSMKSLQRGIRLDSQRFDEALTRVTE